MTKAIRKDIIPLLISVILVIISIGITLFTEYILNYKHYLGIVLLGISSLLYFKNKELFVYFFGLTLILGIFNLIDIYYVNILFGTGSIEFNPIFLTLLIIFFALNREILKKLFPKKEIDTEKEKGNQERAVKNFETKFINKTEAELRNIIDEDSPYVKEARIAGKRLLEKKYVL